ncbi:MAG: Hercynine oxygenase [bacterium]|nr:Hercynine oxygenase [bacterium]
MAKPSKSNSPKVFISYAWKNQATARQLQRDLQRDGIEVFVDYEKIVGGDSLPARISAALDWCDTIILLWSQEAAQSYWVAQEWESAFQLQKRIIPCVLERATLPALLRGRLYLDFSSYAAGYQQLCRTLGVTPGADQAARPQPPPQAAPPRQHVDLSPGDQPDAQSPGRGGRREKEQAISPEGFDASALGHGVSPRAGSSARHAENKASVTFTRPFWSRRTKAVLAVLGLAAAITIWRLIFPPAPPDAGSDPSSAESTAQKPPQTSKGSVRLHSLFAGSVFIDGVRVGEIASRQPKDYPLEIGSHQIEVRGASETQKATFTIAQGQTKEVTLRPSIKAPTVPQQASREPTKGPPEGMVLIPAGSFLMGSDDGASDEKPVHEVYVDAFYLDQYEVTVAQYQSYLRATGRSNPENWDEQLQNPNRPVVYVSWEDATNYAQWAGKRLPTEAEWEYAARGGNTGMAGKPKYNYPWGNDISPTKANYDADGSRQWNWDNAKRYLRNVGSFSANGYGLYDMAGNVWEWCADWYADHYYSKSPKQNPKGPATGDYRVLRGGSWNLNPLNLRCAYRVRSFPSFRNFYMGFRCAQDAR